ncbi:MAG: dTDP-4-dehydrorhamnose reductase [Candidatus Eiseniibacteriota bacterium]|nr:MAG: dTDP-4-dehydrorhamnose reductase [Candidatus Eisenbacteria bacterium]
MKVLVTGARGMLGTDVCEVLSQKHDVTGVDIEEAEISSLPETRALVKRVSPDAVIHCAAYTDVDGSETEAVHAFLVNAEGTRNVAVACEGIGAVLLYVSTDYVFDGRSERPYTETDAPAPLSVYGSSKLEGERHVQSLTSNHFIVRTSWLFGLHGRNFVDTIVDLGQDRDSIEVVDDQVGCPTFSRDLSVALASIIESESYGTYHVCNSGSVSWCGFAEEILRLWGNTRTRVVPVKTERLNRPAARPAFSVLDTSLFETTFGSSLRSWREALAEYVKSKKRGN